MIQIVRLYIIIYIYNRYINYIRLDILYFILASKIKYKHYI